ncbi:MAG: PorV/PorQ family protein [Gemmatimonadota bacterium]
MKAAIQAVRAVIAVIAMLGVAAPLLAQNAGETGAQVLQFNAGARASALSGAYTSAHADADALFYNPAGIAAARTGASVAYENYATDITFGSLAGFTQFGSVRVGASIVYLDAGEIPERIPDPEFGNNTGIATGNSVSAGEIAARVSAALPLRDGRMRLGGSLGFVSVGVAEETRRAAVADVGVQYDVASITLAAAARNIGGTLSGDDAPLPTELRMGALVPISTSSGLGVNVFADAISRLRESSFAFASGIEAGIMPAATREIGAVARVGYETEAGQLAGFRFGAGVTLRAVSFDYAYHSFDFVGAVHRLGVRWTL